MQVSLDADVLSWGQLFANPMDCNLPGFSVHGIFHAWILEWVAISFSIPYMLLCTYNLLAQRDLMAPLAYWQKQASKQTLNSSASCYATLLLNRSWLWQSFLKGHRNHRQISECLGNRKISHPLRTVTTKFPLYVAMCWNATWDVILFTTVHLPKRK